MELIASPAARQGDQATVWILRVIGEVTDSQVGRFRRALTHLVPRVCAAAPEGETALVIDLGESRGLGQAALGVLVTLHHRLRERGAHLRLENLGPELLADLRACCLDRILGLPAPENAEQAA